MMPIPTRQDLIDRFWLYVDKTDTCWLWTGALTHNGYGVYRFEGKIERAHRLSWMFVNGEIPNDLQVLHKCDVRRCVKPSCLFLGTDADNKRDMHRKRRLGRNNAGQYTKIGVEEE